MGVVHSSHNTIYVQEVRQLEKQKNEAKDEEERKELEQQVKLKTLERDLAYSKMVRQKLNFTTDVVCHEVVVGSVQWAEPPTLVCSGVRGEQLLTLCLCKGCSVHVH